MHYLKYNKLDHKNLIHISCQLLHVSTPRCHQLQRLVGTTYIFGTNHSHFHNKSCVILSFKHFRAFSFHGGNVNRIYIPQTVLQQANTYGLFGFRIIQFSWRNYSIQKKYSFYAGSWLGPYYYWHTHACTHAHKFSHT
jgi:hypothetical protein